MFIIVGKKDMYSLSLFIFVLLRVMVFLKKSPFISTISFKLVLIVMLNCFSFSAIKFFDLLVLKLFPIDIKLIASRTVVFPLPFGP